MEGESAIQQDAQVVQPEVKKDEKPREKTAREQAMDALKASRRASFEQESGVKLDEAAPAEVKAESDPAPAADLSISSQLGKQLDDGTIELSAADLARIRVRTKVDGKEELVEGTKALGQYQKSAAAEVRLERATQAQREAEQALAGARAKLEEANGAAEKKAADKAAATASADVVAKRKQYFEAVYSGDEEKAGKLLDELLDATIESKISGRVKDATPIDHDAIARRAAELAVPVVKQVASRESALKTSRDDYPEIFNDADFALVADRNINALIAEGKNEADAIADGVAAAAKKLGIKKSSERQSPSATTTRSERLAAKKEGLDEPDATAARAATSVAPPLTASERIEQMRKARTGGAVA